MTAGEQFWVDAFKLWYKADPFPEKSVGSYETPRAFRAINEFDQAMADMKQEIARAAFVAGAKAAMSAAKFSESLVAV